MASKKKAVKKSAAKPVKKIAPVKKPTPKTVSTAAAAKVAARAMQEESCCGGSCCISREETRCCGFSISCPLLGVLTTRAFWLASVLTFIIIFGFDMWWNGQLLMPDYQATAHFWRPYNQIEQFMPWCFLRHVGLAMAVSALVLLMGRTNWWGGLITGVLAMTPVAIEQASVYMYMSLPMHLPAMWAVGSLLQGGLMGLAVTSIARLKQSGCCGGSCACK